MTAEPSKYVQFNSRLARAFGTASGAVGVATGENGLFIAQCAEMTYLRACDTAAHVAAVVRAALTR